MINANFAATPNSSGAVISTANTNVDGSGTLATIWTAGASGGRLDTIKLKGRVAEGATQAADVVRFFWDDGVAKHFFTEVNIPVGSGNVSVSVPNFETTIAVGVSVKAGWILKAGTHTGGGTASYDGSGFGGDY